MRAQSKKVLIIDDERLVRVSIAEYLSDYGFEVDMAADAYEAQSMLEKCAYAVAIMDIRMPGMDGLELLAKVKQQYSDMMVIMISGHGTMETAIEALRLGADDFFTKPIELKGILRIVSKAVITREMRLRHQIISPSRDLIKTVSVQPEGMNVIVGDSEWTNQLRNQVRLLAEANCDTILVTGETGTGKEVVARALHGMFPKSGPFIAVSCPALPESLVESELFGHVKGAFTGATEERDGCFTLANGGTLFLDEVGDLSMAAQAKILRALETRSVRKVGGSVETAVNVRVVAATNVSLLEAVDAGRFRSDLYYRLNLFGIHTEPLRERRGDVLPLAQHFLNGFILGRGTAALAFSDDALQALEQYAFPGNVRELKNMVERAAIMCGKDTIHVEHLAFQERQHSSSNSIGISGVTTEASRIRAALDDTKWNRKEACKLLGMPYSTLRYKMEKLGIK